MNRLDTVVVFHGLSSSQLRDILDIELARVQDRIHSAQPGREFTFDCTPETKGFLIHEGTDAKYGARPLKRAIERHLVLPLARLLSTTQIAAGDHVTVDIVPGKAELVFLKDDSAIALPKTLLQDNYDELWNCYESPYSLN
jgi:ATP-dependent Clp protease ATP-binding subunit ClpA